MQLRFAQDNGGKELTCDTITTTRTLRAKSKQQPYKILFIKVKSVR